MRHLIDSFAARPTSLPADRALSDTDRRRAARTCREWTRSVSIAPLFSSGPDPCLGNIFFPGRSAQAIVAGNLAPGPTTLHDASAIREHPVRMRLNYVSAADRRNGGLAHQWYTSICQVGSTHDCHEFPYYATAQSGGPLPPWPGAKVSPVNINDNRAQGGYLSAFTKSRKCSFTSGGPLASPLNPEGTPYIVVPMVFGSAPRTFGLCR